MELDGDFGFLENENDIIGDIDWDVLLEGSNSLEDVLELESPVPLPSGPTASSPSSSSSSPSSTVEEAPSNLSPDSFPSWMGEIETILMKDDDDAANKVDSAKNEYYDQFLADILVDSPSTDSPTDADSDKEKADQPPLNDEADEADDPISKKRRRQVRNKDAAVRSRERRKMYVRDLEMKSKYFESECRRLGHLLQCCYAENHTLRLSLQMGNAYAHGASATKQESAVLFLELLLLGSLLWCVDIMCLLALPLTLMALRPNPLSNVEASKALESVGLRLRGEASKMFQHSLLQSFSKGRRCKASRPKMKHSHQILYFLSSYVSFALPLSMLTT